MSQRNIASGRIVSHEIPPFETAQEGRVRVLVAICITIHEFSIRIDEFCIKIEKICIDHDDCNATMTRLRTPAALSTGSSQLG